MKKIMIMGLIGTLLLSSVGCQAKAVEVKDEETPTVVAVNDTSNQTDNCTIREDVEALEYEHVDYRQLKDTEIMDKIDSMMQEEGHYAFVYDGSQYVAVFAGERSTGGYSIEVDAVSLENNTVFVYALETKPDPDMMTTQALTYPLAVVKLIDFEAKEGIDFAVAISSLDDEEHYVSPTDDIEVGGTITIGEIITFDKGQIHIISGDLVEVFNYNEDNASDFYLGQMVELIKGEDGNNLKAYDKEDYTITHTNMGHMIDQVTGTLKTIGDGFIIVESEGKETEITTYNAVYLQEGGEVTAYTVTFDEKPSSIMIISEESKLSLTVIEASRTDEGSLDLLLKDENGGEYRMDLSYVSCEFDISKVEVGDVLTVYHQGIMESWPMQIDTILVRK